MKGRTSYVSIFESMNVDLKIVIVISQYSPLCPYAGL